MKLLCWTIVLLNGKLNRIIRKLPRAKPLALDSDQLEFSEVCNFLSEMIDTIIVGLIKYFLLYFSENFCTCLRGTSGHQSWFCGKLLFQNFESEGT